MPNPIDISIYLIEKIFGAQLEKNFDLRLSWCLFIKIVFFMIWFIAGGEDKFSGFNYAMTLIVWLIFHAYIVVFEMQYIKLGRNNVKFRQTLFKIVDFIQMAILLIYFLVQVHAFENLLAFNYLMIYDLFLDAALNFDQFFHIEDKQYRQSGTPEEVEQNIRIYGGEVIFYFSMVVGGAIACFVIFQLLPYSQLHPSFPFHPTLLYCAFIGELAFMFYALKLFGEEMKIARENIHLHQVTRWHKRILTFMYGLCIGIFNIYYAMILGIYCIYQLCKFLYECYRNRGINRRVQPI